MWTWLKERYDCDFEVKRYYVKPANFYYTKLDISLTRVPVFLMKAEHLRSGSINADTFKLQYVQVKSTNHYGDLKKRLADVATAVLAASAEEPIKADSIRMWSCTNESGLFESFKQI